MRPIIELARFFRPSFAGQSTNLSASAIKYFSSSAKCTNTVDDSGASNKPEVLESAQNIDPAKVEAHHELRATDIKRSNVKWSTDDRRKLRDALDKGMRIKAIAALFPTKTHGSIKGQSELYLYNASSSRLDERQPSHRWQPAGIELLRKLHKDRASFRNLSAHFPAQSVWAIKQAMFNAKRPATTPARRRLWSQEETRHLVQHVLEGADAHAIAKTLNRSRSSVARKASWMNLRLFSNAKRVSAEQIEQILQMRTDGASFETIAAAVELTPSSVRNHWTRLRPITDRDLRSRTRRKYLPTQLTLGDFQTIRSLRDQDASWSSIGSESSQYQLDAIKQDFRRFTKRELSSTDMRKIQELRQGGKSWRAIVETGDYPFASGNGLRTAYDRVLRNE